MEAPFHLFDAGEAGPHLLVSEGSQVFSVDKALADELRAALHRSPTDVASVLAREGLGTLRFGLSAPLDAPPMRALSLAVAQRCNLGCTYCYAEGGDFGAPPRDMEWSVAEAAVRRLIAGAAPGERVNIAFLGGEPLSNRTLIRAATDLASGLAAASGVRVGFSITTNGTLLSEADAELFERHRFSVTVSLDGIGATHDRLRPTKGGRGSFDRIAVAVARLAERHPALPLAARVTVTPANLDLRTTLDGLLGLGFASVGFSPMLHAPGGRGEMQEMDLDQLLDAMIGCGLEYERRRLAGEPYGFANLDTALREIHRGTHRPYPCGAGAGYFGVSATGELSACHRFVGDPERRLGDVTTGVDTERQAAWLASRRVERQSPCSSCWARYLCGGGCHYEAIHRGRPACDYIRGWLDYALGAYVRMSARLPALFEPGGFDAA
jgi:uncharacterized protein